MFLYGPIVPAVQRSFDDLGVPLRDVTFCIVDLETTGGSPDADAITEIGAVKVRGGECEGTFQTLVRPGMAIPPAITMLTGITDAMVAPAPRIDSVLPSFLEFSRGTVLVAHNARFDVGFLNAALARANRPRLTNAVVDTCALARRLVRDEVPNCKLSTLADRFRLDHRPSHRALDDALATADLLHLLLERAGTLGVLGLDDLLALPKLDAHPQAAKLRLTQHLPRTPGVYLFLGPRDEVLYVGKATNLRQRVRSYFSGDERRKVGPLLREMVAFRHVPCASTLEAAVLEVRLIHRHQPRYNRQAKLWQKYAYVRLTLDERFPRLTVVKAPRAGGLHVGPLPSAAAARLVIDAVHTTVPLRRCSARIGRHPHATAACAPAQLGVASCPCSGAIDEAAYARLVDVVTLGFTGSADLLLDPLHARMQALAVAGRFEEAADMRDRAAALSAAFRKQRRIDALRTAASLRLVLPGGVEAQFHQGVLSRQPTDDEADQLALTLPSLDDMAADEAIDPRAPLPRHLVDELSAVAAWLDAEASRVRVAHCDGTLALPIGRLPSFTATAGRAGRRAG